MQWTIEADDKLCREKTDEEKPTFLGPTCMCAKRALRIDLSNTTPGYAAEPGRMYIFVMMFRVSLVRGLV